MKYPIGVQDFEKLRTGGYVYIDKTHHVYELVTQGNCYFLGRPRRFGKSLLISTFEAYFKGKRELFQGLALEKLEKDWTEYPVLHLDLNTAQYNDELSLNGVLNDAICQWENLYGSSSSEVTPALRFKGIIRRAVEQTGRQVVILVDEYDKPILQTFNNPALQDELRSELKAFYSVLKTQDRYIRFAFLTGVTKFGKVSVFSDLNNLNDISMDDRYIDICGMTEREVRECFGESISGLAEANGLTFEEACQKLSEHYDGYHFDVDTPGIYNPFSLLNTFDKGKFRNYWFETGTPTFLYDILRRTDYNLNRLQDGEVTSSVLTSVDSVTRNPIPVIYQSGYLTIKSYNKEFDTYTLDFPNKEVEDGFIKYLLPLYVPNDMDEPVLSVTRFVEDVRRGDPESFMERLQTFFDDADYRVTGKMEVYFQNALYLIFKIMGFYTEVERATSRGRIDVVIKTRDYIYVIECKRDSSAADALQQIEDKGYARPFAQDSRRLYKIGINFSSEIRGIDYWKVVEG